MENEIIDVSLGGKKGEKRNNSFNLEEFLEKNKLTIGLLMVGIILIGAGTLGFKIFDFSNNEPKVEILGTEDGSGKLEAGTGGIEKITVEAAGEVEKPGVYNLATGSRVNDLLVSAGGLSERADRDWVSKNINMAQKLTDGVKIYIPKKNEIPNSNNQIPNNDQFSNFKININTASESQLDTLWGIGVATAKKIIEARPYQRPEELLEKKVIKSNVWEAIKDKVSVF